MTIWIDPTGLGGTDPEWKPQNGPDGSTPASIANALGFGGYHLVTRVHGSIQGGNFVTTIEAQFDYSGDGSLDKRTPKQKRQINPDTGTSLEQATLATSDCAIVISKIEQAAFANQVGYDFTSDGAQGHVDSIQSTANAKGAGNEGIAVQASSDDDVEGYKNIKTDGSSRDIFKSWTTSAGNSSDIGKRHNESPLSPLYKQDEYTPKNTSFDDNAPNPLGNYNIESLIAEDDYSGVTSPAYLEGENYGHVIDDADKTFYFKQKLISKTDQYTLIDEDGNITGYLPVLLLTGCDGSIKRYVKFMAGLNTLELGVLTTTEAASIKMINQRVFDGRTHDWATEVVQRGAGGGPCGEK